MLWRGIIYYSTQVYKNMAMLKLAPKEPPTNNMFPINQRNLKDMARGISKGHSGIHSSEERKRYKE